jgi:hypothetical protein
LADLEYNKKLAEEGEKRGYHTLAYKNAKAAKYLVDLPKNLRIQIYDIQRLTSNIYVRRKGLSVEEINKLKELLDSTIPEFKKYLGN